MCVVLMKVLHLRFGVQVLMLMSHAALAAVLPPCTDAPEDYEALSSNDDDDFTTEGQYDDVLGYIDDYSAAKTQRRAAHGAPRRLCTQTAWVGGDKLKAKATARARQQKHSLVAVERHKIAEVQHIRRRTRAQRT